MDHLPYPEDAKFRPAAVPYTCKVPYDGGKFAGYPERCGFNKTLFYDGSFAQVPPDTRAEFFQAWLYFGMLSEVLEANLNEFVNERELLVTTTKLPFWTRKWQRRFRRMSKSAKYKELERIHECLAEVAAIMKFLKYEASMGHGVFDEDVEMSILVLAETLETVVSSTYLDLVGQSSPFTVEWPNSRKTQLRLLTGGLCSSEMRKIQAYLGASGQYYFSALPDFGKTSDHSRCEEQKCVAENIDEDTYRCRHVEAICCCSSQGPCMADICAVLDTGSFPLVELTRDDPTSEVKIRVVPHQWHIPYTAISHVWADGLGNPHDNKLPRCQLQRLHNLVQLLNGHDEGLTLGSKARNKVLHLPVTFGISKRNVCYIWIDTLCVPLDNEHRKKAISLMRHTYQKAKRVLVLDRSLISIPTSKPLEELFYRLTFSPWMRRVWTLQEGLLACDLFVQFSDQPLHMKSAIERLYSRCEDSNAYLTTLRDACSSFYNLSVSADVFSSITWKLIPGGNNVNVASVSRLFAFRETSHEEDIPVCLAMVLNINVSKVMDAHGDDRMCRLYLQMRHVPKGIVFSRGARLDIPNFRWVPRKVVGVSSGEDDDALCTEDGIRFRSPGVLFQAEDLRRKRGSRFDFADKDSGAQYIVRSLVPSPQSPWSHNSLHSSAGRETFAIVLPNELPSQATRDSATMEGIFIRISERAEVSDVNGIWPRLHSDSTISGEYLGRVSIKSLQANGYRFQARWVLLREEGLRIVQDMQTMRHDLLELPIGTEDSEDQVRRKASENAARTDAWLRECKALQNEQLEIDTEYTMPKATVGSGSGSREDGAEQSTEPELVSSIASSQSDPATVGPLATIRRQMDQTFDDKDFDVLAILHRITEHMQAHKAVVGEVRSKRQKWLIG